MSENPNPVRVERSRDTFPPSNVPRLRSGRTGFYVTLILSGAALAQPGLPDRPTGKERGCRPFAEQLYIAPMGEPFRAPAGQPYPAAAWFAAADADHDGQLSQAEFTADAERFFRRLDTDRDGEFDPPELSAYEKDVAPEIRLYQRPSQRWIEGKLSKEERAAVEAYGGAMGAGRWAQLNIPQPVAAADADYNRGITRDEFRRAAVKRFALLGAAPLRLAVLKPTPAEATAITCAAGAAKRRGR